MENDTQKILMDFAIKQDHLIWTRRPDLVKIIKKKEREKR